MGKELLLGLGSTGTSFTHHVLVLPLEEAELGPQKCLLSWKRGKLRIIKQDLCGAHNVKVFCRSLDIPVK